jgi:hypothetical protein
MDWIDVKRKLPDSRRRVMVAYHSALFGGPNSIGIARCNVDRRGNGDFGIGSIYWPVRVTHWAEIPAAPEYERVSWLRQAT